MSDRGQEERSINETHNGGFQAPCRRCIGTITPDDETIYDPPLRLLVVGKGGTIEIVCDADDESDESQRSTIVVEKNERITDFAIRQIRKSSSASGLIGFR